MPKLTQRTLKALRPRPDGGDLVVFDDALPGFGVRVKPSGAVSWLIQYRNAHGRSRRLTLAPYGRGETKLTPEQARKQAKLKLAEVADGADPAADKRTARGAITVAELCDEYLKAGEGRIKASTLLMDRSRIERHVKPLLGTRAVASLTPADMEGFLRDVMVGKTAPKRNGTAKDGKRRLGGQTTGGPGVAARALGMLGTILQRAVRDGVLTSNPARGIARPKDQPKKPPFSFEAVAAVGRAMRVREAGGENVVGLRAIRFLMLTGLRRMESLTLTWGMVDKRARCIRFEDTKSGKQTRPLGRTALEWLASFEPKDAKAPDYVFPGTEAGKHLIGLPKIWARVAKDAQLGGVSLHGLRHWYASAAAEMNFSELTIAGLLGHRVKGVTARYATAPDSAFLAAADRVSMRLSEILEGREFGGNVVSIGSL
jgi:site-specific recombinase XerD